MSDTTTPLYVARNRIHLPAPPPEPAAYQRAASEPYGSVEYADPGYLDSQGNQAKGGNGQKRYPIDEQHVMAAWSYINQQKNQKGYTAEQLSAIKGRIRAAMKRHGHDVSDDGDSSTSSSERDLTPLGPIEVRESQIEGVNFAQRIITTIAAPYEQFALVPGGQGFGRQGEVWREIFTRGAFASITSAPQRIRANRDHDKARLVGKVQTFSDSPAGLVAEVRCAKTPLGDETLELADEGCLGASVGFATRQRDHELDRFTKTRRVNHAYLDHLAFVASPAYEGANVLSVRETTPVPTAGREATPYLDHALQDPVFLWASERLNKQ